MTARPLAAAAAGDPADGALLAAYDRKAAHTRACLHWLSGLGVRVISVHHYQHLEAPQIVVASGARLFHALPADDIAWIGQRHGPDGRIDHYLSAHLGCAIRWAQEHAPGLPPPF